MCDACINMARAFERSLTPVQREGFEKWQQQEEREENQQQFDLGYDEAKADDSKIFELIAEGPVRKTRERLARLMALEYDEPGLSVDLAELKTLLDTVPDSLRLPT